jgi:hypothetical protein
VRQPRKASTPLRPHAGSASDALTNDIQATCKPDYPERQASAVSSGAPAAPARTLARPMVMRKELATARLTAPVER